MRKAYFGGTPLNFINIINTHISYFDGIPADLFVYNLSPQSAVYAHMIRELGIFDNVYVVAEKSCGFLGHLTDQFNILLNRNSYFHGHEPLCNYDEVFIPGLSYFARVMYAQIKKQNQFLKLSYIEDGVGAYIGRNVYYTSSLKKKILHALNSYDIFSAEISSFYVYEPSLSSLPMDKTIQIPKINKYGRVAELLEKLFPDEEYGISNAVIFIDEPLPRNVFSFSEFDIFEKIRESLPHDRKLLIKLHPLSPKTKYGDNIDYIKTSLPFEILFMKSHFDNVVLLNPFSTILFSLQLMFGEHISVKIVTLSSFLTEINQFDVNQSTQLFLNKYNDLASRFIAKFAVTNYFFPTTPQELLRDLK